MRKCSCRQTPSGAPTNLPGSRSLSAASPSVQGERQADDRDQACAEGGVRRPNDQAGWRAISGLDPRRRRAPGSADSTQPTLELYGLLTTEEAAALLHLSPWTLRHWVLDRRIPCVRLGRLVRFRLADLEALIDGRSTRRAKVA